MALSRVVALRRGELSNAFGDRCDYPQIHFNQSKCDRWPASTCAAGDPQAENGFVVSTEGVSPASFEQASHDEPAVPTPPRASGEPR